MKAKNFMVILKAVFVLFFISDMSYGDKRIKKIRSIYNEVKQFEEGIGNEHFHHDIILNTMHSVIGLQTTKIRFIYDSMQVDPEEDPYHLSHQLRKVIVRYNISASANYLIEYLFDEKQNLIFYFWQEKTMETNETRCYFYKKRLIRVIKDYKNDQGKSVKSTAKKNFKKNDLQDARSILKKANKYKKMFRQILSIEQLR